MLFPHAAFNDDVPITFPDLPTRQSCCIPSKTHKHLQFTTSYSNSWYELTGRERDDVALKLECDEKLGSWYHVFETCQEAEIQVKLSQRYSESTFQHADEVTKIQNDCRAKGKKQGGFFPPHLMYINRKYLVLLSYKQAVWDVSVKQQLTCVIIYRVAEHLDFSAKLCPWYFYFCMELCFYKRAMYMF